MPADNPLRMEGATADGAPVDEMRPHGFFRGDGIGGVLDRFGNSGRILFLQEFIRRVEGDGTAILGIIENGGEHLGGNACESQGGGHLITKNSATRQITPPGRWEGR